MRILYSLPHPADALDGADGHVVRATRLLDALEERGHEILRVEAGGATTARAAVGAYRQVVRRMIPRAAALRLRDAGRVVHGRRHGARIIADAEAARPDVILETHVAFSLSGVLAARATGIPLVVDDFAPSWEEDVYYGAGLKGTARRIHGRVADAARFVIAVNGPIRRVLIDDGVPPEKIAVVPNGFDASFAPRGGRPMSRARLGIAEDAVVIGYVGSFQPFHRVPMLIEAFARLPEGRPTHLLLIGDGGSADECRAAIADLGVGTRVTMTGAVPNAQVAAQLGLADVAVLAATNDYGDPMKLYEYLALGLAIVAPDQEAIREVVSDAEVMLFARDDVNALAAALGSLVADDTARSRLGRAAATAAPRHSWTERAHALERTLERAIGANPAPGDGTV